MDKQTRDVLDHMLRGFVSWMSEELPSVARRHCDAARALLDATEQPEQPQPAEFPRVWIALVKGEDGSLVPMLGKTSRHEYVHISELEAANVELERLREAALRVIERHNDESRSFGDEYETRREPLTEAMALLREIAHGCD